MSFMFLFGLRRRIFAGVELLIPGIGTRMTILTPGRSASIAMTSHAQTMVGAFQAWLVLGVFVQGRAG